MLQIFRVEHEITGLGPFQTRDEYTQELATMSAKDPSLKFPGQDGLPLGNIPFCFVFGCLDLPTLKRWFLLGASNVENSEIVSKLKSRCFRIAEYLVENNDCIISNSKIQVAFSARDCKEDGLVQYHSLDLLLLATN